MKLRNTVAAVALLSALTTAHATPLTLNYTKTALDGGLFQYDFSLVLDNHDGSWSAGQQWDWIVFGDTDEVGTYKSFNTKPTWCDSGHFSWNPLEQSALITGNYISCGGHNGATLAIVEQGVILPGWMPAAVGEVLNFSGTSNIDFLEHELHWSALIVGGGAAAVSFDTAVQQAVPEPGTLALALLGLGGLAMRRARRG